MQSAKEKILNTIQQALVKPVAMPFADTNNNDFVYQPSKQELEIEFAENFIALQGKFSYCSNFNEFLEQITSLITTNNWKKIVCKESSLFCTPYEQYFNAFNTTQDLASCDAAITTCEALVARTGSLLLSSANESGRTNSVYAPIHICVCYTSQLVYDISDALLLLKNKYGNNLPSLISLATGPSRTADIEKTLVVGVHGPKEVFCFLIQD